MAYRLRKAPKRDAYWVVGQDGSHMSKKPIPLERAKRQMRALYAAERQQKMKGGFIDRATFEQRRSRGMYPADMSYEKFAEISGANEDEIARITAEAPEMAAQYLAENPGAQMVRCRFNKAGEIKTTNMSADECAAAQAEWERINHPANYYFFRPAVEGLTTAADIGASLLEDVPGIGKVASKVYQGFAPPGSAYYSDGSFGEKAVGTAASLFGLGVSGGRGFSREEMEEREEIRLRSLEAKIRYSFKEAFDYIDSKIMYGHLLQNDIIQAMEHFIAPEYRELWLGMLDTHLQSKGVTVVDGLEGGKMRGGVRLSPPLIGFLSGLATAGATAGAAAATIPSLGVGGTTLFALSAGAIVGFIGRYIARAIKERLITREQARELEAEARRVAEEARARDEPVLIEMPRMAVMNPDGSMSLAYGAPAAPAPVPRAAADMYAAAIGAPRAVQPAAAAAEAPEEDMRVIENPMRRGRGHPAHRILTSIRRHGCEARIPRGLEARLELEGAGIFGDIWSGIKKYTGRVVDVVRHGKRQDYPPKVRDLLARIGNQPIVSARLRRDPIKAPLNIALNLITQGRWEQAKRKYAYDKLFHLGLEVVVRVSDSSTSNGTYIIEKNEVINVAPANPATPDTETLPVDVRSGATLNSLLNGAKKVQGAAYFNYDAFRNNCQDFIIAVLNGSGLATPNNTAWVKQPVSELVTELPGYTSTVANLATDIGALANVVIHGRGGNRVVSSGPYGKMEIITDPNWKQKFNAKLQSDYEARQVQSLENAKADQERYLEEHMAANPFDRFIRNVGTVGNVVADVASLIPGPVGNAFGALTSVRDALTGSGGATPRSRFAKQLKAAGIDPAEYLRRAQQKADEAGLAHELLGFSDDDKHKLQIPNRDGRIVRFGAVGLGDHILYTLARDPKAAQHRKRYLARATKIKGKWREDEYSPNSLSIKILWNG